MANHVSLTNREYTILRSKVNTIHADCMSQVNFIIAQLRKLDGTTVGFEARELTTNIRTLLQELATTKDTISTVFEANEEIFSSFETVVKEYDSLN